jgi:hypothetical protein
MVILEECRLDQGKFAKEATRLLIPKRGLFPSSKRQLHGENKGFQVIGIL